MAESTYDRYSTFLINGRQTVVPGIRLTSKGTDKRYVYVSNVSRLDKISQEFYNYLVGLFYKQTHNLVVWKLTYQTTHYLPFRSH